MPRSVTVFVLLALAGLVGLVVLAFSDGDDAPRPDDPVDAEDDDYVVVDVFEGPDPVVETDPGEGQPIVPRILPPDAALEDVRDALVANDPSALKDADARIGRLARVNQQSLRALQRQIAATDDPRIRGVALAATGLEGGEASLRFLCGHLRADAPSEEVVGALLGLFRLRDGDVGERQVLVVPTLGELTICVNELPPYDYVKRAFERFLDSTRVPSDAEGAEVGSLLAAATGSSSALAEMLVDGGRLRPYVVALPPSALERIKRVALAHDDLSEEAQRAFEGD